MITERFNEGAKRKVDVASRVRNRNGLQMAPRAQKRSDSSHLDDEPHRSFAEERSHSRDL